MSGLFKVRVRNRRVRAGVLAFVSGQLVIDKVKGDTMANGRS